MSGISTSSVTMSGLSCRTLDRAMRPLDAVPTTSMPGSSLRTFVTSRRMTTESSTTRTLILLTDPLSDLSEAEQALLLDDGFLREGLDDVFVRAGSECLDDLRSLALGSDHHQRHVAPRLFSANGVDELEAVHLGHVPVDERDLRQRTFAKHRKAFPAVGCVYDVVADLAKDPPEDHSHGS